MEQCLKVVALKSEMRKHLSPVPTLISYEGPGFLSLYHQTMGGIQPFASVWEKVKVTSMIIPYLKNRQPQNKFQLYNLNQIKFLYRKNN